LLTEAKQKIKIEFRITFHVGFLIYRKIGKKMEFTDKFGKASRWLRGEKV
jgi:hypothetical protein